MAAAPKPKEKEVKKTAKGMDPPTPGEALDTGLVMLGKGLGHTVTGAGKLGGKLVDAGKQAISDQFYMPANILGSAPIVDTLYKIGQGYNQVRPEAPDLRTAQAPQQAPPEAAPTGIGALSNVTPEQPANDMALRQVATAPSNPRAPAPLPAAPAAPRAGVDVLAMLQQAQPAAAAPEAGPPPADPILEMIQKRQAQMSEQLAAASAAAAPKQPTIWDAIGKLAAGVAPVAIGALAGKAAGLGAGAGAGIGAGVGADALRRMELEEQGRAKEDREAAKENLRFARQQAAGAEEEGLRFAIGERAHKRGVAEEIAKEGRAFNYDQAKMKMEDMYKRGQISLTQSMEIQKELVKQQMENAVQYGDDQDYNAIINRFGKDKEALKQGREDLERDRLFNSAVAEGGTFDKVKAQITDLESKIRVPGAGKFAQATGVGRYAREAEEINATLMNVANSVMSSKGGDARYSPEKMKQLIKPFLYNTGVGLKENLGNVDQLIKTLESVKGESAILKQAGVHVGQKIMTAADAEQLSDQVLAQARAKGWKIKDTDGTIY